MAVADPKSTPCCTAVSRHIALTKSKRSCGSKELCGQGTFVHNSSGASRSIDDILMPGGQPIGVKASGPRASARLREVTGGQAEAERIFQELTGGGKDVTPAGYPGTLILQRYLADGEGCNRL